MTDAMTPATRGDALAARRRARENCGACGGAWFGQVAYCPYCGVSSSASEPAAASDEDSDFDFDFPAAATSAADASKPEALAGDADSWTSWARPLASGALLGVLLVVIAMLVLRSFGYSP